MHLRSFATCDTGKFDILSSAKRAGMDRRIEIYEMWPFLSQPMPDFFDLTASFSKYKISNEVRPKFYTWVLTVKLH